MVMEVSRSQSLSAQTQWIPTGLDGGNGVTKLVFDKGAEVCCPAYYLPLAGDLLQIPQPVAGGYVEYVSGDRLDLQNKRWLTGLPAYRSQPKSVLRVVQNPLGKIEYGLQTFLGAIATLPYQSFWNLNLVASIQDAKVHGDALKQALEGGHHVRFNGHSLLSTVHVKVLTVVEEGIGAAWLQMSQKAIDSQIVIIDIGAGTTITSVYGPGGELINRTVANTGVSSLIEAIAKDLVGMRQKLGHEGDRHLIERAIQDQTFVYGKNPDTAFPFEGLYQEQLALWIQQSLAPALTAASGWFNDAETVVAIGGGSQLPFVGQYLQKKGVKPLANGNLSNPQGLAAIARVKSSDVRGRN